MTVILTVCGLLLAVFAAYGAHIEYQTTESYFALGGVLGSLLVAFLAAYKLSVAAWAKFISCDD